MVPAYEPGRLGLHEPHALRDGYVGRILDGQPSRQGLPAQQLLLQRAALHLRQQPDKLTTRRSVTVSPD